MPEIPITSIDRLIRKDHNVRVSMDASEELRTILEDISKNIVRKAVDLMNQAGRKTISSEDIFLAYKMLFDKEF